MDWQFSSLLRTATPPPSPPRYLSIHPHWKPHKAIPPSSISSHAPRTGGGAGVHHDYSLSSYSRMLQVCTSRGSLAHGKAVHGRLLRVGIDPDSHLWDCLLNMYCKCGSLEGARLLFDQMPHRDVVAWTSLMTAYASTDYGEEAVRLFCEMMANGVWPNGYALASGLKACSINRDLNFAQQLHGGVLKMQFLSDSFVASSLIDLYAKCGEMELAEKVFLHLPEKNVSSWNTLLGGYAFWGKHMKVFRLFQQLMNSGMMVNEFTLSTIIKCCAGTDDERHGLSVHCLVIKFGLEQDVFLSSSLVDMYAKCGLAEEAYKVFMRIVDPDVVVWSAMISCFSWQGLNTEAVKLFRSMGRMGIRANHYTLASVAGAALELGDQALCGSLHAYCLKNGFETRKEVSNAILNMYMKNGATIDGLVVFDAMVDRDIISWNTLLSGFHSGIFCDKGLTIFKDMLTENIMPNNYTYISILRSCTSLNDASYGSQVHAHILKNNLAADFFLGRALVDMYASSGHLENACLVFNRLSVRDVFSWTVIITGYTNTNQGEKSIDCFRQMQQEGSYPNEFTVSSCLGACSDLAALYSGRQFHACAIKSGLTGPYISCNLVNMYAKCGCLMDAEAAFVDSSSRDEVLWNTLICNYSQHGCVGKVIESFQQMIEEGKRPDEVTFIGILSACSHAGLLNEGMKFFNHMYHVYEITPTIEHHRCMVDILGKAARLDEVEKIINDMGLSSDVSIWQTALGACRMHGNVEFAERAATNLFKLDPNMDSSYILMSNIYAASRRWADVNRIRRVMATRGIKKEPGCSWIEINGQFHVFMAEDII
ncbi:pentatricopeptide repeat-containing protein [Canna indica]|uniref:Pentatricopeptide repeat-containing protein n=1 Tax=Canna indica TaxID=4628 RepID=A0AAQ3QJ49_9LILI|nr:pentatricopeptide repeat-containing protein [Canna indica]